MQILEKMIKRRRELKEEIERVSKKIAFFEKENPADGKFFIGCGNETTWHTAIQITHAEFGKSVIPIMQNRLEVFKTKLAHLDKRIEAAELLFSEFE